MSSRYWLALLLLVTTPALGADGPDSTGDEQAQRSEREERQARMKESVGKAELDDEATGQVFLLVEGYIAKLARSYRDRGGPMQREELRQRLDEELRPELEERRLWGEKADPFLEQAEQRLDRMRLLAVAFEQAEGELKAAVEQALYFDDERVAMFGFLREWVERNGVLLRGDVARRYDELEQETDGWLDDEDRAQMLRRARESAVLEKLAPHFSEALISEELQPRLALAVAELVEARHRLRVTQS